MVRGQWQGLCVLALSSVALCQSKEVELSSAELVKDLLGAQQRAADGVIQFNPTTFSKYVAGKQRPFTLFMFLKADHLADKPGLPLGQMRREFGYVAKTFKDSIAKGEVALPGTVFFADAEFKDSQELFKRLGVSTLPFVFVLPGGVAVDRERIRLRPDDQLRIDTYEKFPWTADEFSAFLTDRVGISVGRVTRPSLLTSPLFPFLALGTLALGAAVGYRLYYANFMKNMLIWCTGAIVVYWFSVSGGMHNIIRGIPLYVLTQQGAQFFMPPGQGQLGAEGFACGTGYLLVGLSVTGVTFFDRLAPRLDARKRRAIAFGIMAVGVWSFIQVTNVYRWKTGYRWRTYFGGWSSS